MPKFTLPGHNYLGPGNPYPNGTPTNSADQIAQQHDKSYIDATSEQDILDSDWKYTKEFASDFVSHPSIGSAVGAVGLGVKTGAERILGVQYPDMNKLKRHQSGTISSSDNKKPAMGDLYEDADMADPTAAGGVGGSHGAAGLDSRSSFIFKGNKSAPEYITKTFNKTYHFFTENPLPDYTKPVQTGGQNNSYSIDRKSVV